MLHSPSAAGPSDFTHLSLMVLDAVATSRAPAPADLVAGALCAASSRIRDARSGSLLRFWCCVAAVGLLRSFPASSSLSALLDASGAAAASSALRDAANSGDLLLAHAAALLGAQLLLMEEAQGAELLGVGRPFGPAARREEEEEALITTTTCLACIRAAEAELPQAAALAARRLRGRRGYAELLQSLAWVAYGMHRRSALRAFELLKAGQGVLTPDTRAPWRPTALTLLRGLAPPLREALGRAEGQPREAAFRALAVLFAAHEKWSVGASAALWMSWWRVEGVAVGAAVARSVRAVAGGASGDAEWWERDASACLWGACALDAILCGAVRLDEAGGGREAAKAVALAAWREAGHVALCRLLTKASLRLSRIDRRDLCAAWEALEVLHWSARGLCVAAMAQSKQRLLALYFSRAPAPPPAEERPPPGAEAEAAARRSGAGVRARELLKLALMPALHGLRVASAVREGLRGADLRAYDDEMAEMEERLDFEPQLLPERAVRACCALLARLLLPNGDGASAALTVDAVRENWIALLDEGLATAEAALLGDSLPRPTPVDPERDDQNAAQLVRHIANGFAMLSASGGAA